MLELIIFNGLIGIGIGGLFTIFFVNFDKTWIKILAALAGIGGSAVSIDKLNEYFEIKDRTPKIVGASVMLFAMYVTIFLTMAAMCFLIKDKDDEDVLRIRDILLGQKAYIDTYYEKRKKQIDNSLNIPALEERERKVEQLEQALVSQRSLIDTELDALKNQGKSKLHFELPDKKSILVKKEFLEALPSYIGDFANCVGMMKKETELLLNQEVTNNVQITACLLPLITCISEHFFGESNDIRIHFRYYNFTSKKYEKLIAIIGKDQIVRDMTPIPFHGTMIEKSYICKRAVIKSINAEYDYKSNNSAKWQDYITITFYNLLKENQPYLSFGISVKNAARYKDLFYFLSFSRLENYINDSIEALNAKFDFAKLLYEQERNENE